MFKKECSLRCLGISWKGFPTQWPTVPLSLLPVVNAKGEVYDSSGVKLFELKPLRELGRGQFGRVDAFWQIFPTGERRLVAMKRPNAQNLDLKLEALFQWGLRKELEMYQVEFCIPQVYSLVRHFRCQEAWFLMEAFEPLLLHKWCEKTVAQNAAFAARRSFPLLLLQIALILQLIENELDIDHRDLKVNNILIVEKPVSIKIFWKGEEKIFEFPFHVVFLDFGYACAGMHMDVREIDGIPTISPCPNPGRDIFQVLVSLWRIQGVRFALQRTWGSWIQKCLSEVIPFLPFLKMIETRSDLDWMYTVTDDPTFSAPNCAPASIIHDCLTFLEAE